MPKKLKKEPAFQVESAENLEAIKTIVLTNGNRFAVLREDGAYFYCDGFKIRKTNPSIHSIENITFAIETATEPEADPASEEPVPFEETEIGDEVMDNGNDE